jgi:hypothetical protein
MKYEDMVIARRKADYEREKAQFMQQAKADAERKRREREERMRKQREEEEQREKEEEEKRQRLEEERKRREEEVCHLASLRAHLPPVPPALYLPRVASSRVPKPGGGGRDGIERGVAGGLGAGEAAVADFCARSRCPLVELRAGQSAD